MVVHEGRDGTVRAHAGARGELELDAPVCEYWPEFAKNGKDAITVRMLLAHQAGLAAFREPIPEPATATGT